MRLEQYYINLFPCTHRRSRRERVKLSCIRLWGGGGGGGGAQMLLPLLYYTNFIKDHRS